MGLTQAFVPSIVLEKKSNDNEEEQMDILDPLVQEVFRDQIPTSQDDGQSCFNVLLEPTTGCNSSSNCGLNNEGKVA
jgi:hypothetical protein